MSRFRLFQIPFLALAAFAFVFSLPACGRKGDIIPPGTVLPAPVKDLRAESREGAVLLAWTMPSENADGTPLDDLAGFDILRAEFPEGADECPCEFKPVGRVELDFPAGAVVKGNRVAWKDAGAGLAFGVRYSYTVRPFNLDGYGGRESNTAALSLLQPPPVPDGLSATPGNRSVSLIWNYTALDSEQATGFNVYRRDASGGPLGMPLNALPVTGTSYVDRGLDNGKEYYYRVSALRGASPPYTEGALSGEAIAVPADTVPPETPSGLQAVPSYGLVLLSWLPGMDEDLKGYILYRMGPDDLAPTPLPGMPAMFISYEDKEVEAGMTYTYAVSAVDREVPPNESPLSEGVTITVPVKDRE